MIITISLVKCTATQTLGHAHGGWMFQGKQQVGVMTKWWDSKTGALKEDVHPSDMCSQCHRGHATDSKLTIGFRHQILGPWYIRPFQMIPCQPEHEAQKVADCQGSTMGLDQPVLHHHLPELTVDDQTSGWVSDHLWSASWAEGGHDERSVAGAFLIGGPLR